MEFLDEKRIKNVSEIQVSSYLSKYVPAPKKAGGINGEISELRYKIVAMLNAPVKPKKVPQSTKTYKPVSLIVLASLTKGWTAQELYPIYRCSVAFTKNPAALFWKLYKEHKQKYGKQIKERIYKRGLRKMGSQSWKDKQSEGQGLLF